MSAEEAWQEWDAWAEHNEPAGGYDSHSAFIAGYRRALEDAADAIPTMDQMCKCGDERSIHSENGAHCYTIVIDRPCECPGFRPVIPMSAGDRDTLAALLAEHDRAETITPEGWFLCNCLDPSMRLTAAQVWSHDNRALHRAHVADVLLASDWLREQRAEAWDEGHDHCCDGICYGDDPANPYRTTEDA